MDKLKIILIILGLFAAAFIVFALFSLVYSVLYYLFFAGVIGLLGYGGYKLLKKDEKPAQLNDKTPTAIADLNDTDRALNEYKKKYLAE